MIPRLVVRPEKLYEHSRPVRGARRQDGLFGRTLALFDTIGVFNRPHRIHMTLSRAAKRRLVERASELRVSQAGLAAFLVEKALRGDQ